MPERDRTNNLANHFRDRFLAGDRFQSITQARKSVSDYLGQPIQPGSRQAKQLDESVEQGLVRAAKAIIQAGEDSGDSPAATYDRLVDLYQRQPRLGTRSSTSIERQQYSTPVPIAYLASRLAGVDRDCDVYEPTAGHGALLAEADPQRSTVNELDDDRAADLHRQGYEVTQHDAVNWRPGRQADVVIANPPFGCRQGQNGRAEQFEIGGDLTKIRTIHLDHAIAWKSLEAMKDDGRATLILGSEHGTQQSRSDKYNQQQNRGFFYNLYKNYNVTNHFTIDGGLYGRQGAGFPIDVIQIDGRGTSQRELPAADVPKLYTSYDELKETLNYGVSRERTASSDRDARLSIFPESQRLEADGNGRGCAPDAPVLADPPAEQPNSNSRLHGLSESGSRQGRVADLPLQLAARDSSDRSIRLYRDQSEENRRRFDDPRTDNQRSGVGTDSDREFVVAGNVAARDSDGAARASATNPPGRGGEGASHRGDSGRDEPRRMVTRNSGRVKKHREPSPFTEFEESSMPEDDNRNNPEQQQVRYQPQSKHSSLDTLIPRNLQGSARESLDSLEERVGGDIDEFVRDCVGFESEEDSKDALAGEQVDGTALAIDRIENDQGALIGDQTGVGKGRQLASILKYAKETDRTPIFVTQKPSLYADMIRDLEDVGEAGFNPFVTDRDTKVPLPDGREINTKPGQKKQEIDDILKSGELPDEYDGIFTTYSQMQTVRGKEPPRRELLRQFAPNSVMVLDEAHEAGGSPDRQSLPGQASNRAEFARELVDDAEGVAFSSATAIKRPDVLDLYGRRTGMTEALGGVKDLQNVLEGGIPLQQASSAMLTRDGNYTRRERSYEGVDFGIEQVDVSRESTDGMAEIMGSILQFDRAKQDAVISIDEELKKEAKSVSEDNAIGKSGADSTNFTALMHNVMDQAQVARKSDQMADEAIASLERDEKPVIAVSNTMGSFIEQVAERDDLHRGDEFTANFSDVMKRYLYRSREVQEKNFRGERERRMLTDEELGTEGVEAFERAEKLIDDTDLDFPVSPIDRVRQRIEDAGYSFEEITGRQHALDYDEDGNATYRKRGSKETSQAAKIQTTDNFNNGDTDALLLNRSGATGISLHSGEKFQDRRRRHMIVGQAERDVNAFIQTLGRVHRTGQVEPPKISIVMSDVPDEKRPAAMLEKKMASLNANTTASRSSGFDTSEIPDFFNEYGSAVVENMMEDYPDVNAKLDYPVGLSGSGNREQANDEDAIRKVTGRLPLLSVDEQGQFYEELEEEYKAMSERQKALGNNILEADFRDLDVQPIAQANIIESDPNSSSAFANGVRAEIANVNAPSKPKTQLEVTNEVRRGLGLDSISNLEDYEPDKVRGSAEFERDETLEKVDRATDAYRNRQHQKIRDRSSLEPKDPNADNAEEERQRLAEKFQSRLDAEDKKIDKQRSHIKEEVEQFPRGQTVRLAAKGRGEEGRTFYGAITDIRKRGQSLDDSITGADNSNQLGDNPLAASKWEMLVSIADSAREMAIPVSKLNTGRIGSITMNPAEESAAGENIMQMFDDRQSESSREVRQVLRGNMLKAAHQYGNQGDMINATTRDGGVEPIMLMDRNFDLNKEQEKSNVLLPHDRNINQFFELTEDKGKVQTEDGRLTLTKHGEKYQLETSRGASDYYLNRDLTDAIGDDFYSKGSDRMVANFNWDRFDNVLGEIKYVMGHSKTMQAASHKDTARELVGEQTLKFDWHESIDKQAVKSLGFPEHPKLEDFKGKEVRNKLNALLPDKLYEEGKTEDNMALKQNDNGETDKINLENSNSSKEQQDEQDKQQLSDKFSSFSRDIETEMWNNEDGDSIGIKLQSEGVTSDDFDSYIFEKTLEYFDDSYTAEPDPDTDRDAVQAVEEASKKAGVSNQLDAVISRVRGNYTKQQQELDSSISLEQAKRSSSQITQDIEERRQEAEKEEQQKLEDQGRLYEGKKPSEREDADFLKEHLHGAFKEKYELDDEAATERVNDLFGTWENEGYNAIYDKYLEDLSEDWNKQVKDLVAEASHEDSQEAHRTVYSEIEKREIQNSHEEMGEAAKRVSGMLDEFSGDRTQIKGEHDYRDTITFLRSDARDRLSEEERQTVNESFDRAEEVMQSYQKLGKSIDSMEELLDSYEADAPERVITEAIEDEDEELDAMLVSAEEEESQVPSVDTFRDWYQSARKLARSDEELGKIEQYGKAAKAGELDSFEESEEMEETIATAQQQSRIGENVVSNARSFISAAKDAGIVKEKNGETSLEGKHYQVTQCNDRVEVSGKESGAKVISDLDREGNENIREAHDLSDKDSKRWDSLGNRSAEDLQTRKQKQRQSKQQKQSAEVER